MNRRHCLVAVAGLVALSLALVFPVPRALSQAEQTPRVWQYKVLPLGNVEQDALNQEGASGWELVAISAGKAYLKKPL